MIQLRNELWIIMYVSPDEAWNIFPFACEHIVTNFVVLLLENCSLFSLFWTVWHRNSWGVIAVKINTSHVTRPDWNICPVQVKSLHFAPKPCKAIILEAKIRLSEDLISVRWWSQYWIPPEKYWLNQFWLCGQPASDIIIRRLLFGSEFH